MRTKLTTGVTWLARAGLAALIVLTDWSGATAGSPVTNQRPAEAQNPPAGKAHLTELHDIGSLREAFRNDDGKIRLVTLLSPT